MVGLRRPLTHLVEGPHGPLELLTRGRGEPSTLCVHGLSGSIASTRPYAGRVPGRTSFVHIAGHGASAVPPEVTYAALASEVWAAAEVTQARAALGVSMGAGALINGLVADPGRFAAVVLVLPAALDRPRDDAGMAWANELAQAVRTGDVDTVAAQVARYEPPGTPDCEPARAWCREQAVALVEGSPYAALVQVPTAVPVVDAAALSAVTLPVLILAQEGDAAHPVPVARALAEVLPQAHLEIFDEGGLLWAHRDRVRRLVGDFVAEHTS